MCFYVVALPAAYLFAFKLNLSIAGLWLGIGLGPIIQMCLFFWLLLRSDWVKIAEKVQRDHLEGQDEGKDEY